MRSRLARILAVVVMAGAPLNATVAAPDTTFSLLYTAGGDYEPALGLGVYSERQEGVGFYINGLTTIREREPHYDSLNVDSFGDPVTDRFQELTLLSLGVTRSFGARFSGYVGLGYGWATGIAEKNDPTRILADDGEYYVDDPANDDSGANANAGVLLRIGAITLDIGYQSFSESVHFGIGASF